MSMPTSQSRVLQALDALKRFDRRGGAAFLADELRHGPKTGVVWRGVSRLATQIGESEMALEAAARFARTEPVSIERLLHYWGELAAHGRPDSALAEIACLPPALREHPNVLHLLGALAGEAGDFSRAEEFYRQALAKANAPQTWFALAMIKTFTANDPDLSAMARLRHSIAGYDAATQARFLYGLAKAWDDCGDQELAFALYEEGAALRRAEMRFDGKALARFADGLIRDFDRQALTRFAPSQLRTSRALFVNGLPRSGTTLVEQIIASHSSVVGGAELNLVRAALIPTGDYTLAGAKAYQSRMGSDPDPWGELGRDYHRMLDMRFGASGLVVDKTLSQSHFMGLLLHMLPGAKVIWLRRNPADTALSCFRSFFTAAIPWSWSLADIGTYFRIEDRLYAHWAALFPDRILTVPYEGLAQAPEEWIARILGHLDLADEPRVHEFHKTKRNVRTASVQQVRAPISSSRVGSAARYGSLMDDFHAAYGA